MREEENEKRDDEKAPTGYVIKQKLHRDSMQRYSGTTYSRDMAAAVPVAVPRILTVKSSGVRP